LPVSLKAAPLTAFVPKAMVLFGFRSRSSSTRRHYDLDYHHPNLRAGVMHHRSLIEMVWKPGARLWTPSRSIFLAALPEKACASASTGGERV
jgi:hypothetical protein